MYNGILADLREKLGNTDEAKKYLTTGSEDGDGEKDKVRRQDVGSTPTPCPTWVSCLIVSELLIFPN